MESGCLLLIAYRLSGILFLLSRIDWDTTQSVDTLMIIQYREIVGQNYRRVQDYFFMEAVQHLKGFISELPDCLDSHSFLKDKILKVAIGVLLLRSTIDQR